jgi:hypothetical protein
LTAKLKAAGWSLLFLVGGFGVGLAFLALLQSITHISGGEHSLTEGALEATALIAGYTVLTWLIGGKALKLALADFGLVPAARGARGFGWGLAIGVVLAGLAMAIAAPLGHAAWRSDGGSAGSWLGAVLLTSCVLLPAAFAEELAFRGVPMVALSRSFGRVPAVLVLAVLFALAHFNNPGLSALALANIALAGVLLSFAFFTPGGLWTSTGVHFGWNITLAALAAPVSGIGLPMPGLDYSPGGPRWLTGGGFGPEGGVVATACLIAGCGIAGRRLSPAQRKGAAA